MSAADWNIDNPEETFWFNTRTNEVEVGKQSLNKDRLGPFASADEAARALEIIAARAAKIRQEDELED